MSNGNKATWCNKIGDHTETSNNAFCPFYLHGGIEVEQDPRGSFQVQKSFLISICCSFPFHLRLCRVSMTWFKLINFKLSPKLLSLEETKIKSATKSMGGRGRILFQILPPPSSSPTADVFQIKWPNLITDFRERKMPEWLMHARTQVCWLLLQHQVGGVRRCLVASLFCLSLWKPFPTLPICLTLPFPTPYPRVPSLHLFLPCKQARLYHFSRFHTHALTYVCVFLFLSYFIL